MALLPRFTRRPAPRRSALALVPATALLPLLAAGCANGVQSTAPASGPVVSAGPSSAGPSDSVSPSSAATASSGASSGSGSARSSTPTPSATGSSPAGPAATCTVGNLRIGVRAAKGGSAAGSNYFVLTFANTSTSECTLSGWPGVSFVGDRNGTQLGAPAIRVQPDSRSTVKLAPGATTTALLRIVNAGDFGSCRSANADGLRVYPPGSRASAFVAYRVSACRDTKAQQLQVSPVGTSG